jgi:HD-GYP domain-containing protein (c-di-GMP phosphodiesterase class II)
MILRPVARIYIATLGGLAVLLLLGGLQDWRDLAAQRDLLALAFAGLTTLAYLFPLHFAYKTKIALDTAVIFAAALLFEPGVAMLLVAEGALLAQFLRRQPAVQTLFNTSQITLQTGAGAYLLAWAGWQHQGMQFDQPQQIAVIVLAAVLMYAINTLSVAWVIGLQTGMSPWLVWRQTAAFGNIEDLSQFALGLLAAVVVDVHAWTLPLLVLPALVVYLSLQRNLRLRQQTLDAVQALADIVDLRDPYTADHSRRVAGYARELAIGLNLSPAEIDQVEMAARVHDIGKIVVDHDVLAKDGRLAPHEWQQLQSHPNTGATVLANFPQFAQATSFVRHHHERMDGSGYPDHLPDAQIPLGAKIIGVADALDAMATDRPYRPALPLTVVKAEFQLGRGSQWDAQVVDVLFELLANGRIVPGTTPAPAAVLMTAPRGLLPFPSVARAASS